MLKKIMRWIRSKYHNNRYVYMFVLSIVILLLLYNIRNIADVEIVSYISKEVNLLVSKFLEFCSNHIELTAAVFSAFIAILAIEQNARVSEGSLIKELNNEFINNEGLSVIEAQLEKYFDQYKKNGNSNNGIDLEIDKEIGGSDRQALANYLVHLEAVGALVNNRVLHLRAINDLMAYRFFIALNNPVVQKLELEPYFYYYSGCIKVYMKWEKVLLKDKIPIPMEENGKTIEILARKIKERE